MKKILFSIVSLFMCLGSYAQTSGAVVTTSPSNFTAEDLVVITIDVSAVGNLAGKSPLYFWVWNPSEPAPGNGSWGNSNEARRLTNVGTNKWTLTMKPTDFFGKPPSEITKIQFLVKAKDGAGDAKTDDITLNVTPLIFIPTVNRIFPSRVSQYDISTIYFDQTLATDIIQQRMNPQTVEIKIYNTVTSSLALVTISKTLRQEGAKLFSYSFISNDVSGIPSNTTLSRFEYKFIGTILDINGNTIPAESPVYVKQFDLLQ
ncbi:MAG: hypothetical protein ABL929_01520 [Ferruginibacter sp.]|nr:hypothetical protein [Ferruginibacter sp.]